MALVITGNNRISEMVEIFEELPAQDQETILNTIKKLRMLIMAQKIDAAVARGKKAKNKGLTEQEIVDEVNQYRKERGYKAYNIWYQYLDFLFL